MKTKLKAMLDAYRNGDRGPIGYHELANLIVEDGGQAADGQVYLDAVDAAAADVKIAGMNVICDPTLKPDEIVIDFMGGTRGDGETRRVMAVDLKAKESAVSLHKERVFNEIMVNAVTFGNGPFTFTEQAFQETTSYLDNLTRDALHPGYAVFKNDGRQPGDALPSGMMECTACQGSGLVAAA